MAPGTSIGAAHPVGGGGEDIKGTMGRKIVNFTASFSEAIAHKRGRNVEWAARAVRRSVSITAEEAAKLNVVDFVAKDLDEVVARADGRTVDVAGESRKLALGRAVRGADGHVRVHSYEMRLSQRVLNVIADPQIAMLLMMAGLLGLYVEFTHPGLAFPGVAGAICLLLALAAPHVLPVNTSPPPLLLPGGALPGAGTAGAGRARAATRRVLDGGERRGRGRGGAGRGGRSGRAPAAGAARPPRGPLKGGSDARLAGRSRDRAGVPAERAQGAARI